MKERDETRDRFLLAIAERLPVEHIAEVHLFQPLRQGGAESGVAVVAVRESAESQADALEASEPSAESREPRAASRMAVYTARYRLTQKGPERGKWEFALQVEADAPLITVDRVVQGVQRRSGDAEEPRRLSGDEFRELAPQPERR
jgi:hypothetical protein